MQKHLPRSPGPGAMGCFPFSPPRRVVPERREAAPAPARRSIGPCGLRSVARCALCVVRCALLRVSTHRPVSTVRHGVQGQQRVHSALREGTPAPITNGQRATGPRAAPRAPVGANWANVSFCPPPAVTPDCSRFAAHQPPSHQRTATPDTWIRDGSQGAQGGQSAGWRLHAGRRRAKGASGSTRQPNENEVGRTSRRASRI
jgi:hypothetical protein